jgi:hypothetical protein
MKWKSLVFVLGLTLFLFQSCVPSLHPLYTSDVLAWSKDIAGTWLPTDDDYEAGSKANIWHFVANKDKSFQLTQYDSNGKPGTFEAHLVKLGENYFFDLAPRTATSEEKASDPAFNKECLTDLESIHYFPMHTFAKVSFSANELSIAMFDGDFLNDLLEQNRIRIKHEKVDGEYVLTASSKELQNFMMKYADDPKAFMDPMLLRK